MPYEVHFRDREGVVELVNRGAISAAELIGQTDDSLLLMREHRVLSVLGNSRDAVADFLSTEFYWLPKYYDDQGGNRRVRNAVLLPEDDRQLAAFELYGNAARNRAYQARLFRGRADAHAWLREDRGG